jgi:glycine/D-amino acid oxidase-like deaminating enzyme/nitrite reductase/ring-hydroxylating ferredoxin subunit
VRPNAENAALPRLTQLPDHVKASPARPASWNDHRQKTLAGGQVSMNVGDEKTRSLWMDVEVAPAAPLKRNEEADTVIIGSGIAGLSTAYELSLQGQSVVVLDRGKIGKGMTARTTAHLSFLCDDSFESLIRTRGVDLARLFLQSQMASVDRIESIQKIERIECNFRRLPGYLFPALGTESSELQSEFEAGKQVGIDVDWATGIPFKGLSKLRCLRYANQGTFHPLRYLRGLAAAITAKGGRLYSDTRVDEIQEDGDTVTVKTENGKLVRARWAVVATNSPINDRLAVHTKQAPYRTYAMAITLPKEAIKDALYWDTADPYHYVRLQPGRGNFDYVIAGGADHKTGEADDAEARFDAVEAWIRNLLPELGNVTHRWSGQVLDTIDYSAFIGRNPGNENVYIATGDSGQGMTHGVVAGMLLRDLIMQGQSEWTEVYEPSRKPLRGAGNFLSENMTVLKNFAEYVAPGELNSLDELEPGHGAIIRQGMKKIAAYRDDKGKLHLRSAMCTHVGCHVHWNSLEVCWDCPCHGSQFAIDGTALNGPAIMPLAKAD